MVSTNVYRTTAGDVLRPCEMPAATVLAFLRGWTAVPDGAEHAHAPGPPQLGSSTPPGTTAPGG